MQLEHVSAEIRPRAPWESIDLGCALARRHIITIWKAWSLTILPLWVLLALLLRNHPAWFILCSWWLKPVYDRVPLLVVSRALFGAVPNMKEILRAWPRLMVRNLWHALVITRFSPARCLSMPVIELEGLKGAAYRARVNLLEKNGGEGATMATLAGLVLESVAALGIVMLAVMMVPSNVMSDWQLEVFELFSYKDFSEISDGLLWTIAMLYLLAITLMEPFYVSAGFALYINSRTLTEGWDIELAFKRISARLERLRSGSAAVIILLTCMTLTISTANLYAESASPHSQIEDILADEDFTIHHRIEKVPVDNVDSSSVTSPMFLKLLSILGSLMFYTILTLSIVGLIYIVYRNRHIFIPDRLTSSADKKTKTRAVLGMDVRPESLPSDVVAASRSAWADGDCQLALSLLYRGSIASLIHRAHLAIEESDTEADCLGHVKAMMNSQITPYFSNLTQVWISMAYGKEQPDDSTMRELCDAWPFAEMERSLR